MATALTVKTSHPALLSATGLATPPLTPSSPLPSTTTTISPTTPIVSYAQLRAHHVTCLKYVIAKLRWEQMNNGYLRGEDAWYNHNQMIAKLDAELVNAEAVQKGLDRFPNCFAPIAFPKQHGPPTKEKYEADLKAEAEKQRLLDEKMEEQFPFLKQLFIGPKTKQQARNDKLLRENLREGDLEDLSILLPSENFRMLQEGAFKKGGVVPAGGGGGPEKKKVPYEQARQEREKEKLAQLHANEPPKKVVVPPRIGPMTKEEWMNTLPRYGPKTRQEAMLPTQREQRHVILSWLRKPWPVYDDEAAQLMESLGRLALRKMDAEAKAVKEAKLRAEEREKEKAREKEMEKMKEKEREAEREKEEREKQRQKHKAGAGKGDGKEGGNGEEKQDDKAKVKAEAGEKK